MSDVLRGHLIKLCVVIVLTATAFGLSEKLEPTQFAAPLTFEVGQQLPESFDSWQRIESPFMQVSVVSDQTSPNQPYDLVEMVSYRNRDGLTIDLALAWGQRQSQEVKIHQPPLCYKAQGYVIEAITQRQFSMGKQSPVEQFAGVEMIARNARGLEAVSYWMRIGDLFSVSSKDSRQLIFQQGLADVVPDGMLVRASTRVLSADGADKAFAMINQFLTGLVDASPPQLRRIMLESGGSISNQNSQRNEL